MITNLVVKPQALEVWSLKIVSLIYFMVSDIDILTKDILTKFR